MRYRSFSAGIAQFEEQSLKKLDKIMHVLATEGIYELTSLNPIYTGWSRASWLVSKNRPRDMVYSAKTLGWVRGHNTMHRPKWKAGRANNAQEPITQLPRQPGVGTIGRDDKIVFSNAVPYMSIVEEKFGVLYSGVAAIKRKITALAREAKAGRL